jgi:putative transposase
MAEPRHVVPGKTHLGTRRCADRAFRLRPATKPNETNHIVRYILGYAQETTGIELHAVCTMSNHIHHEFTDPEGRHPEFTREVNRMIAKALNALQGQWGNLWAAEKMHVAPIADDAALMDRIAYIVTNPVDAGLVERPEEWAGVNHWGEGAMRIKRPTVYFDPNGDCPEFVELKITRPPLPKGWTAETWDRALKKKIEARVAAAHAEMKKKGRRFLGRKAVLAESFMRRAASREARREPIPKVAASEPNTKEYELFVRKKFLVEYRVAKARWCAGDWGVVFPYGTWWMRVHHGAEVGEPPGWVA